MILWPYMIGCVAIFTGEWPAILLEKASKGHHFKNFLQGPFIRILPKSHLNIGEKLSWFWLELNFSLVTGTALCFLGLT